MAFNDFLHNRKGEPVFLTGLQCHNSSSGTEMIDRTISAVRLYGGNLIEAPVYWCDIEPEKDVYDMSLVRSLADKAKEAGLYLIPLWFGASKNGLFTYAPEYIKRNPEVYRLARNFAGIPVESLSPHCRATLERDKKAFARVMEFLAEYDKDGTVIAVQVYILTGTIQRRRNMSTDSLCLKTFGMWFLKTAAGRYHVPRDRTGGIHGLIYSADMQMRHSVHGSMRRIYRR